MKNFIKTVDNNFLTGYQKAAILLSELGISISERILTCADLSTDEIKNLKYAMKNVGPYNPYNKDLVNNEISVLQEALSFGEKLGIYKEPEHNESVYSALDKDFLQDMAEKDPETVAKLLNTWLDE